MNDKHANIIYLVILYTLLASASLIGISLLFDNDMLFSMGLWIAIIEAISIVIALTFFRTKESLEIIFSRKVIK